VTQFSDVIHYPAEEGVALAELRQVLPKKWRPGYDSAHGCMEGTRLDILKYINDWAMDLHSEPLLWLHGLAGSGKSAIASSVCQQLDERGDGQQFLGASFFCKRDDKNLRDPALILPRITTELANAFPVFGKAVAAALSKNPNLGTNTMIRQFQGLIKNPLLQLCCTRPAAPLVIVIDALDESGTAGERRHLISILREMSGLVPWLKIVVTSRPDKDIRNSFAQPGHKFRQVDLNKWNSSDDIHAYVKKRMGDVAANKGLAPNWPGDDKMQRLAQRGTPLFVWVDVAATFIEAGMKPNERLDRVLASDFCGGEYMQLDALYTAAIEASFGSEGDNAEVFRDVVGIIVVASAYTPLPRPALEALMRVPAGHSVIKDTIDGLGSVLYEDLNNDSAIRLCHPSFMDFLTNPARCCPVRFRIDFLLQNARLASMCLNALIDGLKFNICDLESSHHFNADLTYLADRVKRAIPDALCYSSLHWTTHLAYVSREGQERANVYDLLKAFFSSARPLYWLEVLSLLGEVKAAIAGLPLVVDWIQVRLFLFG
jgi:hypothetical protein